MIGDWNAATQTAEEPQKADVGEMRNGKPRPKRENFPPGGAGQAAYQAAVDSYKSGDSDGDTQRRAISGAF